MQSSVRSFGGEFGAPASETVYRTEHLAEFVRQARVCFLCAALVSPLFLFTDWRFRGQPHFPYAISARLTLEVASIACFAILVRARSFRQYEFVCVAWACLVIPSSTVLVSPHTDIALLVTFILPAIFYLAFPVPFSLALFFGVTCSAATLAAYLSSAPLSRTSFGLVAGMAMSNTVLALVLSQSKRLRRLEWAATRAERKTNRQLSQNRDLLQKILKSVPTPLVIIAKGSGRLIQFNDAARAYLGADFLADPLGVEDYFDRRSWRKLVSTLRSDGQISGFETHVRLPGGLEKDILLSATTVAMAGAEAVLAVFVDITDRKEIETIMKRLASTDALTGLPNRTRFFAVAADEIKRCKRYGRPLAVFMIDIDFFKRINDSQGHEFGDRTLKAFAKLCRKWIRAQDTVARLGGEEFGLLLPETDAPSALALADRLRVAVESLQVGRRAKFLTISIGISEVLAEEATVDAALSRADQALYCAKRSGRNMAVPYKDAECVSRDAIAQLPCVPQ